MDDIDYAEKQEDIDKFSNYINHAYLLQKRAK